MYVGLNVIGEDGLAAVLVCKLGWSGPPPAGDEWTCCRRGDIPSAEVTAWTWAGLEDEPDLWVSLRSPRSLVDHLVRAHGFDRYQRE
jgi:hypothetical protein